jgi:3-hydroxyisobutyrate dehydrogenase-like beta-hydroxyacid dehydrogenase
MWRTVDEIVNNPSVAILGLGEAGAAIAADLIAAGIEVTGWDPVARPQIDGLQLAESAREAVGGASVVLSVNRAAVAAAVAREVAEALAPGTVFADLNTGPPQLKRELAAFVEPPGALFADVALLAPVPGRGLGTPSLASGSGAAALVAALAPLGMPVEALGEQAGEAAERKLLRSVFAKGMAACAIESLAAARAAGCEEWLRGQLVSALTGADEALLDRWLEGSRVHAARRVEEMEASAEMLADLATPARVAVAARDWLAQLAEEGRTAGAA